jgi:hypothetical protein
MYFEILCYLYGWMEGYIYVSMCNSLAFGMILTRFCNHGCTQNHILVPGAHERLKTQNFYFLESGCNYCN